MGDTATVPFCMQDELHEVDGLTVTQSLTKAMDADSGTSILGPYYGQQPCSIKVQVCKTCAAVMNLNSNNESIMHIKQQLSKNYATIKQITQKLRKNYVKINKITQKLQKLRTITQEIRIIT